MGPDSRFKERNESTIELHDDENDAVEAMLLHIYGISYREHFESARQNPMLHLEVCVTGAKYLLPKLEQIGRNAFCSTLSILTDIYVIWEVIELQSKYAGQNDRVDKAVRSFKEQRLHRLITLPDFRKTLVEDGENLKLVTESLALRENMTFVWLVRCRLCDDVISHQDMTFECPDCGTALKDDEGDITPDGEEVRYWRELCPTSREELAASWFSE